jgi:uncharacterized SAM-binding protein YcdF (DUF218 family)
VKKLLVTVFAVLGIFLFIFGWLFFRIYQTSKLDLSHERSEVLSNDRLRSKLLIPRLGLADAIAVLGAAEYAGKPSPVFQARLDHAAELYKKDFAPFIITTGGTHPGEKFSEGAVGKMYLAKNGVPAEKIMVDEESLTTKENIERIADITREKKFQKIIIVSDPFHMYRALVLAKKFGIEALPSPTRKSPISENKWLEIKYMLRETVLILLSLFI